MHNSMKLALLVVLDLAEFAHSFEGAAALGRAKKLPPRSSRLNSSDKIKRFP